MADETAVVAVDGPDTLLAEQNAPRVAVVGGRDGEMWHGIIAIIFGLISGMPIGPATRRLPDPFGDTAG